MPTEVVRAITQSSTAEGKHLIVRKRVIRVLPCAVVPLMTWSGRLPNPVAVKQMLPLGIFEQV